MSNGSPGSKGEEKIFLPVVVWERAYQKFNIHKYTHQGGGADDDDAPYALCAQHLFNPENY